MSVRRARPVRAHRAAAALLLLAAQGCSVMREIPPAQYAEQETRKQVRVTTRDGTTLTFKPAHFSADSVWGEHRVDRGAGAPAPAQTVAFPLDQVTRLEVKQLDWVRTGIVLGIAAVAGIAAIVANQKNQTPPDQGPGRVP